MNSNEKINDLMFQYSIVSRTYRTPEKTLNTYLHLTDGYVQTPISRTQRDEILKAASTHDRYEVGVESYFEPTGDKAIDGYPETMEQELLTIHFHHIFIKAEHFGEINENYRGDRRITILTKIKGGKNGKQELADQL